MNMKYCKQQSGFTLIELMLVAAIIAAISVIGISAYRQQLINFQVDKTALQMQQWMEGAVSFYVNCNQWPGVPNSTDPDLTPLAQLQGYNARGVAVQTCNKTQGAASGVVYVAQGSINNDPWGQAYVLTTPAPGSRQDFQVTTGNTVPNALVGRIAARLPNATPVPPIPPSANSVTASITAPSQGAGSKGVSVMHMEVIQSIQDASNCTNPSNNCIQAGKGDWPACPSSEYTAYFYATPYQMYSPITGGHANLWISAIVVNASKNTTPIFYWEPQLQISGSYGDTTIAGNYMLAIETCVKNSSTLLGSASSGNTNAGFKF
jgi:prepilin-type N-terminal cleavage/methylation domain-containing protein